MVEKQPIARLSANTNNVVLLIEALGGDVRSGMCHCPAHDDRTPSLHVEDENGKLLFFCHAGCSQTAVINALRAQGRWPIPSVPFNVAFPKPTRSDAERRRFALEILRHTQANHGLELAPQLNEYFGRRGIRTVPSDAMLALPHNMDPNGVRRLLPDRPAMVFPVTDGHQVIGCHVTWLLPDLSGKCDDEPKRQFFGPISGGYIKLYAGNLPTHAKLLVAEGVETAMAAAQMASGLPAIAGLSATNLPKINPPSANEYIVAADNDKPGLRGGRALATKLALTGASVRFAVPPNAGTDWNDVLIAELK